MVKGLNYMNYIDIDVYMDDVENTIKNLRRFEFFCNKKVLITGSTGLIGSFLVDCLMKAVNIDIYAVSRKRKNLEARFGGENESLHFIEGDVSTLELEETFDIIINAAGNAYPYAFRETPVETMLGNIMGTYRMLEIAKRNPNCRVLFVSSGEVQEYVNHISPRACYPISKKASETLCISYMVEYDIDVVIARPCHTFGGNITENDNRATAQFISRAAMNKNIELNSTGNQLRSFMYVADCVSGLLSIVAAGVSGSVYGVSTDETCTIRGFAEICANTVGTNAIIRQPDNMEIAEASPIQRQIVDNSELKKIGWKPLYTISDGIAHSIEIVKRQKVNEN
jgi:nucleoside-diphosphate-sugar epimerase